MQPKTVFPQLVVIKLNSTIELGLFFSSGPLPGIPLDLIASLGNCPLSD
jgi:hypothetical protein